MNDASAVGSEPGLVGDDRPWLLLVEDNQVDRRVVTSLLVSMGCQVEEATTAGEAYSAAAGRTYDLILMDCSLPDDTGMAVCQRIRNGGGPNRNVPIIAVTAGSQQQWPAMRQAGMDAILIKPLDREKLHHLLPNWLTKAMGESTAAVEQTAAAATRAAIPPPAGVDASRMAMLRSNARGKYVDLVREVVADYEAEIPPQLELLLKAARQEDLETLQQTAHGIRSASLNIGARELADLALSMQEASDAGGLRTADVEGLLTMMRQAYESAMVWFRAQAQ